MDYYCPLVSVELYGHDSGIILYMINGSRAHLLIQFSLEEDRGNSFNHKSAKRPSRLAVTVAIALSSASGVGSRSPALIRGTLAPAVRLAQHLGVAPLKSEAYGKNNIRVKPILATFKYG